MQNIEYNDTLIDIESDPIEIEDYAWSTDTDPNDKLSNTAKIKIIKPEDLMENTNLDIFGDKNE